jgi:hypothetical protein
VRVSENNKQDQYLSLTPLHTIASDSKIIIEVSTGVGAPEDEWRIRMALKEAQRLKVSGRDVRLIFDGAGTRWLPELVRPDHELYEKFATLRESAPAACKYCASNFGVEKAVRNAGILLLDDYHSNSKLNDLISQKYQILTF